MNTLKNFLFSFQAQENHRNNELLSLLTASFIDAFSGNSNVSTLTAKATEPKTNHSHYLYKQT